MRGVEGIGAELRDRGGDVRCRRIDRIAVLMLALGAGAAAGMALAPGAAASSQTQGAESAAQDSARRRTVWEGVYTEAQAERGKKACTVSSVSTVMAPILGGNPADEVPALVFDAFLMTWRDRTVKDLFDRISRSMPHDSPGSLSSRAYVDIVSYILEANQFPVEPASSNRRASSRL